MPVARPKTKGSNQDFTKDSPVFLTAPQEVALYRGKKLDEYEAEQMRSRIKCPKLIHTVEEKDRKEVPPCTYCGARLYLEGRLNTTAAAAPASQSTAGPAAHQAPSNTSTAPTPQPQVLSGQAMVQALKELKDLKDAELLDDSELQRLKAKVLTGL